MIHDKYGRPILSQNDLVDLLYQNPEQELKDIVCIDPELYNSSLDAFHIDYGYLKSYQIQELSIENFDKQQQSNWYMPDEYKQLDIAKYLLDSCENQEELQRVGQELLLFQDKNMFVLLQYLKYLVDVMRANNLVWGVGRGSSVSSFVLYKLGVHKVNSLYYELDIAEFLKD